MIQSFNISRCKCGKCSLSTVVSGQECSCCMEEDRCREKMEKIDKPEERITPYPGFTSVSLETAIRVKTKAIKTYSHHLALGHTTKDW